MKHILPACIASLALVAPSNAQEPAPKPETPPAPRGLRLNAEGAFPGYTLFSPLQSRTTYLVDLAGKVVHTWETKFGPGNSDYLLANGHLLRCARIEDGASFHGGGIGGRIQEFDWDGQLVWDYAMASETRQQHHDIEPLPNGHVLAIVWDKKSREEALERGRDAEQVPEDGLWPDVILEIEPVRPDGGKIVWEWRVWDHLIQDRDAKKPGYGAVPEHPELVDLNADHRHDAPLSEAQRKEKEQLERDMRSTGYSGGKAPEDQGDEPRDRRGPRLESDWLHTNSIDYDAANDLVLLSVPRMNELWILDHSTTTAQAATHAGGKRGHGGDLLWRWGNPRAYGAGQPSDRKLFAQHDARWIADGSPGAAHVMVFNNGQGRPGGEFSSVDELELPFDPQEGFARATGKAWGPKETVWSFHQEGFYSSFISGADRQPNGDTLVCSGPDGRIFEVTPAGKVVWEYLNPFGGDVPMRGPRGGGQGGPPPGGPPGRGPGPGGPGAGPPGRGAPGGGPGGGGPGGPGPNALFRATRIALDHPALAGRKLEPR